MGEEQVILSMLPARADERRRAFAVVAFFLAIFAVAAPFARIGLAAVPGFIASYQAAVVVNDLITAALLFGQSATARSRSLLVLASGYLFTALTAIVHALTFPGLFAAGGVLGGGAQSTAWLYMFWHGGFPIAVILYAALRGSDRRWTGWDARIGLLGAFAAVTGLVVGITLLTTAGEAWLPAIMAGNSYTPAMTFTVSTVWALSVVALAVLWRRKPHSVLDLWLMVVLYAWLCDIALSAVLNAGRFDLGFYAGRVFGLLASSFVLLVLLLETSALYHRLARSCPA